MKRAMATVVLVCTVLVPMPADAQTVFTCNGLVATIVGTPGADRLIGTPGPDVIVGRGGPDVIRGRGGADVICAGGGADDVAGGGGADFISLGRGNDTASGGPGADHIRGGAGSDTLSGGKGVDTIVGQRGNDVLRGNGAWDNCNGGGGSDTLERCERPIPVVEDLSLLGVDLDTGAAVAIRKLTALLGPPRQDSGWNVGCPFDGPEVNERVISWGGLRAYFYGTPGNRVFNDWSYAVNSETLEPFNPGGPPPSAIVLPEGVHVGDRLWDAAVQYDTNLVRGNFGLGWITRPFPLVELGAFATADSFFDPINTVNVGNYLICD